MIFSREIPFSYLYVITINKILNVKIRKKKKAFSRWTQYHTSNQYRPFYRLISPRTYLKCIEFQILTRDVKLERGQIDTRRIESSMLTRDDLHACWAKCMQRRTIAKASWSCSFASVGYDMQRRNTGSIFSLFRRSSSVWWTSMNLFASENEQRVQRARRSTSRICGQPRISFSGKFLILNEHREVVSEWKKSRSVSTIFFLCQWTGNCNDLESGTRRKYECLSFED